MIDFTFMPYYVPFIALGDLWPKVIHVRAEASAALTRFIYYNTLFLVFVISTDECLK